MKQFVRKPKRSDMMDWRLACWGDHFEVDKADDSYCQAKRKMLDKYGLKVFSISNHLVGQAVTDRIDERHKSIVPPVCMGRWRS